MICYVKNLEHGCRITSDDKTVIEFGLKISFSPCNLCKNTYKLYHIEMQCNAEVNEAQHSRGGVQQIRQKASYIHNVKIVSLSLFS